jgi:5-methylcytosine-specific restriction protein A
MNLLLQPYARPSRPDQDNFIKTLSRPFDLQRAVNNAESESKPDLTQFLNSHPDGKARIWALGDNSNSRSVFKKINVDDLVLFHGKNLIYAYGYISSKIVWKNNDFIWPTGENWDYIYSLRDFVEIPESRRISRESLRQLLPKVGHLSSFFVDLSEVNVDQKDVIRHLQTTPPYVPDKGKNSTLRGPANPPILGEKFKDRKSIWRSFGGQWQPGIMTFPGEDIVNVFTDENGPYPDYRDPETGVVEYRGQGLRGNQRLVMGNKLLEDARINRQPVRYWHRPAGGEWTFESWVVVVDRSLVEESDVDGVSARRIIWFLIPVPSEDRESWPKEFESAPALALEAIESEPTENLLNLLGRYQQICTQLEIEASGKSVVTKPRTLYKRRREARELVIARANDNCEHDRCTGMPPDKNRQGRSILQVDHIVALAEGGHDVPSNMIALCPNCHSAKTYGMHSESLVRRFKSIVKNKEAELRK